MKKTIKRQKVIIVIFVLLLCWVTMTSIDYYLCQKAKEPVFSIIIPFPDQVRYRGLGYTITLPYSGALDTLGEQLEGRFFWGWW